MIDRCNYHMLYFSAEFVVRNVVSGVVVPIESSVAVVGNRIEVGSCAKI